MNVELTKESGAVQNMSQQGQQLAQQQQSHYVLTQLAQQQQMQAQPQVGQQGLGAANVQVSALAAQVYQAIVSEQDQGLKFHLAYGNDPSMIKMHQQLAQNRGVTVEQQMQQLSQQKQNWLAQRQLTPEQFQQCVNEVRHFQQQQSLMKQQQQPQQLTQQQLTQQQWAAQAAALQQVAQQAQQQAHKRAAGMGALEINANQTGMQTTSAQHLGEVALEVERDHARPAQEDALGSIVRDMDKIFNVKRKRGGEIYGSVKTGLVSMSDMDLDVTYFIESVKQSGRRGVLLQQLDTFAKALREHEAKRRKSENAAGDGLPTSASHSALRSPFAYLDIEVVKGARIPVLKFKVRRLDSVPTRPLEQQLPEEIAVDITLNNELGVRNSGLIKAYMTCDFAKTFVMDVKRWAKENGLVLNVTNGLLPSYAYTLMGIAFLQMQGLLPDLTNEKDFPRGFQCWNYNCWMADTHHQDRRNKIIYQDYLTSVKRKFLVDTSFGATNEGALLLLDFFHECGARFDYRCRPWRTSTSPRVVFSIRGGYGRENIDASDSAKCPLGVEDPFDVQDDGMPRVLRCRTPEASHSLAVVLREKGILPDLEGDGYRKRVARGFLWDFYQSAGPLKLQEFAADSAYLRSVMGRDLRESLLTELETGTRMSTEDKSAWSCLLDLLEFEIWEREGLGLLGGWMESGEEQQSKPGNVAVAQVTPAQTQQAGWCTQAVPAAGQPQQNTWSPSDDADCWGHVRDKQWNDQHENDRRLREWLVPRLRESKAVPGEEQSPAAAGMHNTPCYLAATAIVIIGLSGPMVRINKCVGTKVDKGKN
eukprot:g10435.t1